MKMLREFVGTAFLCALVTVSPAQAVSVMTFDGITQSGSGGPSSNVWVEDGITATATGPEDGFLYPFGYHHLPGTAHMDDNYIYPSTITFSMAHKFDAISFDILPSDNWFCADHGDQFDCGIPFDNIALTGLREGTAVAQDSLYMGTEPWTYFFGAEFSMLDSLVIALVFPDFNALDGICNNMPCTHMNIDNVTVSPVLLPPAIVFFISALGLMVAFPAMKRRRLRGLLFVA